jgi:hypothetical protein
MNILLPSYPRCGTHFLAEQFLQKTGVAMKKTHAPMTGKYDLYVTLVRNPKDSIVSRLAMELEFEENPKTMEEYLEICKQEYMVFYKYMIKHVSIIFHYEDIGENVDKMIDYVCEKSDIKRISNVFVDTIEDKPVTGFLKTSKSSKRYAEAKGFMQDKDLEECYNIFMEAEKKAVRFK